MARRPKHSDAMQKARPYSGGNGWLLLSAVLWLFVLADLGRRFGVWSFLLYQLETWTR